MRKLMWFAIGMASAAILGIYLLYGTDMRIPAAVCAMLFLTVLILCYAFRWLKPAAVLLLGSTVTFLWLFLFQSIYLQPVQAQEGKTLPLTITLTEYSRQTPYGIAVEGFTAIEDHTYRITAYVNDTELALKPGDQVIGTFRLQNTTLDAGEEYRYQLSSGTFVLGYPKGSFQFRYAREIPWYGYPAYLAQQIRQNIHDTFPADTLGFAQALLLGDSSLIDYERDTALKLSGIRHIIAVSGLHVTILFSLVYTLTGRKRLLSVLLGIPVLLLFAAVAGFSPSITRACIMHGLMAVAMLFDREYDAPTALSFAVVVMLGVNPYVITSVSFQLSFGCMASILLFSERIRTWIMDPSRWGKLRGRAGKIAGKIASSISVSVSAAVTTTPLCALYFGTVSLVSILTNLLTLWVVTFIFYGIMLACIAGALFFPAGTVVAWAVSWPMRYVLWTAKTLAAFPFSAVYTCSIYILLWLVFCYFLLAVFLCMKKKQPSILSCCAVTGLCLALAVSYLEPLTDDVRMTVLDVGQGQSILLQSEGKTFLVDCGGDSDTSAADAAAEMLLSMGINHLDGAILTHYDRDHAGGMEYLLSRVPADCLYLPVCVDEEGTADALREYDDGVVIFVDEHMRLSFGETKISLITTDFGFTNNESGLCILFQRKDCDILITGDRNIYGERDLLRQITLPDLEVLIVGHHGSKTSTCTELLQAGNPEIAIISVGENHYGHPTEEVLTRLAQFGCEIYRTDRDGTVIYRR